MNSIAVKLRNVSKKYILQYDEKPTLIENILFRKKREIFWALRNIDITIKKGESIGIIGPNGSGKTTLLEVITQITTPTTGSMATSGKIISLIGIEAGFHPELTGRENIFLNGLLIGMAKEEIQSKLKKIISFADIGSFIDTPLYMYSGGMVLRLSFSIIVHASPDILVLDENLSVGDQEFREKSYDKIQELFSEGKTVIIASHYLDFIRTSCDRVIWLNKGRIRKRGKAKQIIKLYRSDNS